MTRTLNVISILSGNNSKREIEVLKQVIRDQARAIEILENEVLEKESLAADVTLALFDKINDYNVLAERIAELEARFNEPSDEAFVRKQSVSNHEQTETAAHAPFKMIAHAMSAIASFLDQTPEVGYSEGRIQSELKLNDFQLGHALNRLAIDGFIELVERCDEMYWRAARGEVVA